MPISLLVFALVSLFSCIEGKSFEADETCVGMQREDRSCYDFNLPDSVRLNVQNLACDAEWTVDEFFTAVLEQDFINFTHPFKEVTWNGISVKYCPVSVRFHVSCPIYTREFTCSCTNSTGNNPFNTSSPPRDKSFSGSTKRQHYVVAATFVISVVILTFFICRTNSTAKYVPRASADEQNLVEEN